MAHRRVLLVDGQVLQSAAFHRGMGKYSLALLEELGKVTGFYAEKKLLISKQNSHKTDKDVIKKYAPEFEIVELGYELLNMQKEYEYPVVLQKNKEVVDSFIDGRHKNDEIDFLILSIFQEEECPAFPTVCKAKYLIAYDLIPLQLHDLYLRLPEVRHRYLCRFSVLNEADHFFPISRTVARDLTAHLGIPSSHITPIYGAQIRRKRIKPRSIKSLKDKKFILMPTGDDYRKNNSRAAAAFEEFNKKHDYAYTMVVTSFFSEVTKAELNAKSDHIYFSGNVDEAELAWLYENAEAVFFPSEYEGLGMPVLEAVEFDRPVVCSDIDVFREMSDSAFVYCDPYDISDMADGLTKALKLKIDKKQYDSILGRYTWAKTAELVRLTLEKGPAILVADTKKVRVAIFAPTPDGFSAIGKVVQEQNYILSRYADIDYYLETGVSEQAKSANLRPNYLGYVARVMKPLEFNESIAKNYDKVIYHIGNGEYHVETLTRALSYPDTVILHDTDIEGLYNVTNAAGLIGPSRLEAEKNLDRLVSPKNGHFLSSLVSKQLKVVIHSEYAQEAVKSSMVGRTSTEIVLANLPTPYLYHVEIRPNPAKLVVALAGIIHPAKGLDLVSEMAKIKLPNMRLSIKIFGFSLVEATHEAALSELDNVELVSSLTDTRFLRELSRSDIIVNYRPDYHGETSLSTLEALRQGKYVIANDAGWFAELPNGIITTVNSSKGIQQAIKQIAKMPAEDRARDADKKLSYIEGSHRIEEYVQMLLGVKS